ncbi:MAG: phosphatidylcholine synthase [Methylocapsa sp.]|nr:phosphatidylcholine synthase [Methylocapsa sp.]
MPFVKGFLVHCFTASGAALGLAALLCASTGQFTAMFALLGAAFIVDAVDGTLARRYRVAETVPQIDGVILDLVVDFLTYVVVPLVALWRSGLLGTPLAAIICAFICAASSLYFADRRMKTHDLWFRGFPAIWNVLVFYMLVFQPGPIISTLAVVIAACLMFTPLVFVHPLRVIRLRLATLMATGAWSVAAVAALVQGLSQSDLSTKAALIGIGIYFVALPLFRNH